MSQQLINRSNDLKKLLDEGFQIEVVDGYLIMRNIPYVNSKKLIKYGILVSELTLAGDITTTPKNHVVLFSGDYPCDSNGVEIASIRHVSQKKTITSSISTDHSFSSKPINDKYHDFYEKMTTYQKILSKPAYSIDSSISARAAISIKSPSTLDIFCYTDTSSSRSGISDINNKIKMNVVSIIGLGGTGSYILDFISKAPINRIRLFDGDKFLQHNAFRAPGAISIEELESKPYKVDYFQKAYSNIRNNIISYRQNISEENISLLDDSDFAFICIDNGKSKSVIIERLEDKGISFIDVGMGILRSEDKLRGIIRTTTSTKDKREHVHALNRIPLCEAFVDNAYASNIQIIELNALNAALAVVKWKKLCGFYDDLEREHHSTYTIDGNILTNEDNI